jgi:NTP pyrophosphatase (non-canonical NTP hydrolase)
MTKVNITFQEVSTINAKRADRWHKGFPASGDGWTGADWSNAAQGEGGEMLEAVQVLLLANGAASHLGLAGNVVKKLRRIDTGIQQAEQEQEKDEAYAAMLKNKLATEIGDVFLYLDLLATYYGLSIEKCIVDTFNRVSKREGFPEVIDRA